MSDRILGVLLVLFSAWYGWEAGSYQIDFGDPVGPAAFPKALAIPLGILGLYLVVRPDPNPDWSSGRYLLMQVAALALLLVYALLLQPAGFILATTILVAGLAALLGARLSRAAVGGVVTSLGFFVLFDWVLGIPLPAGAPFGG